MVTKDIMSECLLQIVVSQQLKLNDLTARLEKCEDWDEKLTHVVIQLTELGTKMRHGKVPKSYLMQLDKIIELLNQF
jgi:hypothetical protein